MDSPSRKDAPTPTDGRSTPLRMNTRPESETEAAVVVGSDDTKAAPTVDVAEKDDDDGSDMVAASSADGERTSPTLSEKAAPMLAKFSSWRKQANANAKDFWSKRRSTSSTIAESIKKSLPLTAATLDANPTADDRKKDAEAKEAETPSADDQHRDSKPLVIDVATDAASAVSPMPQREAHKVPHHLSPIPLRTVDSAPAAVGRNTGMSPYSNSIMSDDASSSFISFNDDDTASSYWSSTYTSDDGMRGTLKWAAASVVDYSMQTYRGRYGRSGSETFDHASSSPSFARANSQLPGAAEKAKSSPAAPSQTHRILQSRAKQHLQDLMETLEPNEYLMLLGHGMLGVNLKPTYLKHGGVYVDYLVKGGAAQKSGIIRPGDALCRIGELDVRKGNILEVPNQIAQARRPVHLIFATGLAEERNINYIDIATAVLHDLVESSDQRTVVRFEEPPGAEEAEETPGEASADDKGENTSPRSDGSDPAMELVKPTSFDDKGAKTQKSDAVLPDIVLSSEGLVRPSLPSAAIRTAFLGRAAQRCNETFFRAERLWSSGVASTDENLVRALKHAFALTTADGRRLPFLVRLWSEADDAAAPQGDASQRNEAQITHSPNAMLMLYLEIFQFVDLFDVTPLDRRREIAQKIANKFFLPIAIGNELVPPMLDFHYMVSDSSLRHLESALKDESTPIDIDLFHDFQQAVVEALSGSHFLSFLVSDECSRMRAYMRNTAPFLNIPLDQVLRQVIADRSTQSKNYLLHAIVYLVGQTDPEESGETNEVVDDVGKGNRTRVENAAAPLCASIFIRRSVLKAIDTIKERKNKETTKLLFDILEKFWLDFLSPSVGSLESTSLSAETRAKVKMLRAELEQIGAPCLHTSLDHDDETSILTIELTIAQLIEPQLVETWESVADCLLYDYAVIDHSKFRSHKIHEWMCREAIISDEENEDDAIPEFSTDCIKRLLRKTILPDGVSSHKPFHSAQAASPTTESRPEQCVAECAVVFGTGVGLGFTHQPTATLTGGEEGIGRYMCQSLLDDEGLSPEEMPPTLEAYAVVPTTPYQQPFQSYKNDSSSSVDGWELSLLNFKVPRADAPPEGDEDSALYGVSLVLRRLGTGVEDGTGNIPTTVEESSSAENGMRLEGSIESGDLRRRVLVKSACSVFDKRLQEQSWRDRRSSGSAVVGVALISRHNAIPSMRQALSNLVHGFAALGTKTLRCNGLVDFFGNFANSDVEPEVLKDFLQPYVEQSLKPWLERPFGAQSVQFENEAGQQLIQSLPPIPLALLFITSLLEQKIVITGSRRSLLLSATTALAEMLRPLKWCHLLVPRVPASLAADLLQYPAPFILGMPASDPGILDAIRELPEDVTLVDLDVGRVILASSFAHNTELSRGTPKNETTARALRTQVLSLAQCLGNVFGACVDPVSWTCDRTSMDSPLEAPYDALKSVCRDFIEELLAGTTSCCYWVEEARDVESARSSDPTVLFDEDRFFRIKEERHKEPFKPLLSPKSEGAKLAMGMDSFGMILEVFLRCQSMNAYVGSRDREEMLFSL